MLIKYSAGMIAMMASQAVVHTVTAPRIQQAATKMKTAGQKRGYTATTHHPILRTSLTHCNPAGGRTRILTGACNKTAARNLCVRMNVPSRFTKVRPNAISGGYVRNRVSVSTHCLRLGSASALSVSSFSGCAT